MNIQEIIRLFFTPLLISSDPGYEVLPMKNLYFALLKKRGPWTIGILRKTRFRDIFQNPENGFLDLSPLPDPNSLKMGPDLSARSGPPTKSGGTPPPPGGGGGVPPFRGAAPELNQPLKSHFTDFFFVNRGDFSYARGY